jgi:uncharacterized OB-fold protein/acyl dehydratase
VTSLSASLQALVGTSGEPRSGPDPVNEPMIRHLVEVIGDRNPIYVDGDAARAVGHPGVVAPPTMLQTWGMGSFFTGAPAPPTAGWGAARLMLREAGFTSILAVDCEQDYIRYLEPGDRVTVTERLESVSPEKQTAVGPGHFVTAREDYRDQHGELVGTQMLRVLCFRPVERRAPRTPPMTTQDTEWWWQGLRDGQLLIQRCGACGRLRHPPSLACPECHSFEWDTVQATGRGTVYSYVVIHHPQSPQHEHPLPVVLVALDEGTRVVGNVAGVARDEIEIGMPVQCELTKGADGLTLPVFRPVVAS